MSNLELDKLVNESMVLNEQKVKSMIPEHLQSSKTALNLTFNENVKNMQKAGVQIYHFGFGQSPFPVIAEFKDALQKHAFHNSYESVPGTPEFLEAICEFHKRYDNFEINSSQIVTGPGSKQMIFTILAVFNGDVIIPSPSWTTYVPQARLTHHSPYFIDILEEDEWHLSPSKLQETIDTMKPHRNKLLIFCNPCNPTGACYSDEQLKNICEVCRRNGIVVIADEIYARFEYSGNHKTLLKHYPEGTIICSGFSKWASAGGWRVGYSIFPSSLDLIKQLVISAASNMYTTAPTPMQYALTEGMQNVKAVDTYILHTRRIMAAVAKFCFSELCAAGVDVVQPGGGFYIFPNFKIIKEPLKKRNILTGDQMCNVILKECNVALMAGGPSFQRPEEELTTRLCFVNFDGQIALEKSKNIGLEVELDNNFIHEYCTPVYNGILALTSWIAHQREAIV